MATPDNPFPRSLYGALRPTSVFTDVLTNGVLVPSGSPFQVPPTAALAYLDRGTIDTSTTGEKYGHVFQFRAPYAFTLGGRVRAKIRWEITALGPGGSIGRPFFRIEKNGAAISGVSNGVGVIKVLNVAAIHDDYHVVCDIPKGTSFAAGDTVDFKVGLEVTTAAAGATLTVRQHADPSVPDNALCFEIDGYMIYT